MHSVSVQGRSVAWKLVRRLCFGRGLGVVTSFFDAIQIGPYSECDAEWLTEQTLDSKHHYQSLENLLRGDITPTDFLYSLQFLIESLYCDLKEREQQLWRENNCYE